MQWIGRFSINTPALLLYPASAPFEFTIVEKSKRGMQILKIREKARDSKPLFERVEGTYEEVKKKLEEFQEQFCKEEGILPPKDIPCV